VYLLYVAYVNYIIKRIWYGMVWYVVCRRLSVKLCTVAKRCVPEQKLLLTAYRKSHMRNRLVGLPK